MANIYKCKSFAINNTSNILWSDPDGYPQARPHNTMIQSTILPRSPSLSFTLALTLLALPAVADEETVLLERGHEGWHFWDQSERPPEAWNTDDFDDTN